MLKMPEAKIREMMFTGRRFTARELEPTGFFNDVVAREHVMPTAMDLAHSIAKKRLPAIRARKLASVALEGLTWMEAQGLSAELVTKADSGEGVSAFLEKRDPRLIDD